MTGNGYTNKPITDWVVEQSVFLEWHDGPLSGFCSLKEPVTEFYFDVISTRENEDDLDDRLFRVHPVKAGTMKMLLEKLSILGEPNGSTWAPVWDHDDKNKLSILDNFVKNLISDATTSNLIIMTKNFEVFSGCWEIKESFDAIGDWFAYLDI